MFNNLKAEMIRRNVSIKELAERTKMNYRTLARKISGKSDFVLSEMEAIKAELKDPILTLDLLFAKNNYITTGDYRNGTHCKF